MLTLSHIPLDLLTRAAASRGHRWLGAVAFGAARPAAASIAIDAPPLPHQPAFAEVWQTDAEVQPGQFEAINYRHDGRVLFGSIALSETDFGADADGAALQKATATAYRQIFALLDRLGFTHLWRVWNFIPRINAESGGIERYRLFNIDRSAAFIDSGRATEGNVPAASAVGSTGKLAIYFLAGRSAPVAIENPRQISAYHYPSEYGPRSPTFSRANLVALDADPILFISGTASIVGHRTLHAGDVAAQAQESLANIDALLTAANARCATRKFARADLLYRVYLRHAGDFAPVAAALREWLGATPRAVYLQADICRAELLVEIEASGGHAADDPC